MPPINPTRRENESIFFIFYLPDKPQQLRRYRYTAYKAKVCELRGRFMAAFMADLSLSLSRDPNNAWRQLVNTHQTPRRGVKSALSDNRSCGSDIDELIR